MAQNTVAVAVSGLRKVYGKKVAVADLTLSVDQGEVFGFLGPNGAGKTTAVKMLMGLVRPTSGSAQLLGRGLGDMEAKRQIGFLPEHFRFPGWLRADELLMFHGKLCGLGNQALRQRVPEVLEMVGLQGRAKDKLETFSKGMLQRIGIAQALVHSPQLVFLDEPTSALDPLGRREVRDLVRELKSRGSTVFLNSHLLTEVEMICDRVAIIDQGVVVREGALSQLLDEEHEVELRVENVNQDMLDELAQLSQSLKVDGDIIILRLDDESGIPGIAEAVIRHGGRLFGLQLKRLTLEDVFVGVVKGGEGR